MTTLTEEMEATNSQAEAPEVTHEATPGDASTRPPREDGLNLLGYYRRTDEDGNSRIVTLPAGNTDILAYEAKGMRFEGYKQG